jgi:polyisoprenoid-binding protein YceI
MVAKTDITGLRESIIAGSTRPCGAWLASPDSLNSNQRKKVESEPMTIKTLNARCSCVALLAMLLLCGKIAVAEQRSFELDPAQTKVSFTLGDVLHTVHGTFRLKRGTISFDEVTGQATGELVVDATSGDSGNHARDSKMHKDILQSQKFPEIIFTPQRFKGTFAKTGRSHLDVEGEFTIHGESHPMTLAVELDSGNSTIADTSFDVPYVKWGMKNPSTFFLRVSDKVQISIHAVARMTNAGMAKPATQKNISR